MCQLNELECRQRSEDMKAEIERFRNGGKLRAARNRQLMLRSILFSLTGWRRNSGMDWK